MYEMENGSVYSSFTPFKRFYYSSVTASALHRPQRIGFSASICLESQQHLSRWCASRISLIVHPAFPVSFILALSNMHRFRICRIELHSKAKQAILVDHKHFEVVHASEFRNHATSTSWNVLWLSGCTAHTHVWSAGFPASLQTYPLKWLHWINCVLCLL